MLKTVQWGLVPLVFAALLARDSNAQTLGWSARQSPAGSLRTLVYYQGVEGQDLNFALSGNGTCLGGANPPASNISFPCGATGNVAAKGDGGAVIFKAVYQPYENIQYYASAGVGNYSLRVASVSVVNSLSGTRQGYLYGAGAKALIWPDTEVKGAFVVPALAVDASAGWQTYFLSGLQPAASQSAAQINQRLDLLQLQLALETSHLFKFEGTRWAAEPYGGLKWIRTQAWLKDIQGGGRVGGMKDTVTPFLGLTLPIYEKEALFAEASFINGVQYSAGLNIRFR